MPELPDIKLYLHALSQHYQGKVLKKVTLRSPFVLRSFEVDIQDLVDREIQDFSRIGKRIVWHFQDDYYLVIHLMIAGRFHRRKPGATANRKNELVAFSFDDSTLMLTEAGTKKRASIHVVTGKDSLAQFERGGLDVFECSLDEFENRIGLHNRTLKRLLTDPRIFDGIGNAYSDEILHSAKLSPFKRAGQLSTEEIGQLFKSIQDVLARWCELLIESTGDRFPEKVTAFRPEMAVHGKYNQPCPVCETAIQRVRYTENEMNYCPKCQTGGKILADRSLSRLLKDDWPRTIEELEK